MWVGGRAVEVHNAHAPPGSSRYVLKPQALAAVARRVDERAEVPQILCGDFNTPQPEQEGQPIRTFAGRYPEVREMWDRLSADLEHPRLRDAYKQVHRAGDPWPYSHRVTRSKHPQGRRYDHIYVSDHFTVQACHYKIKWLDEELSDHAAVECGLTLVE